jgi:ribonuclease HI
VFYWYHNFELKEMFHKMSNKNFPEPYWFHIFTDGSAKDDGNAGAGVYSQKFQISKPAGHNGTCFDGELKAVQLAMKAIKDYHVDRLHSNIVIFVDSQSVLSSLKNCDSHDSGPLEFINNILVNLHRQKVKIKFQWVPSHVGIYGNEMADRLANEGSDMEQHSIEVKFSTAKTNIDKAFKSSLSEYLKTASENKSWNTLLTKEIKSKTRAVYVANFRRRTGHDILRKHLKRFGLVSSSLCNLCNEEDQDSDHLFSCTALKDEQDFIKLNKLNDEEAYANLYWRTRDLSYF